MADRNQIREDYARSAEAAAAALVREWENNSDAERIAWYRDQLEYCVNKIGEMNAETDRLNRVCHAARQKIYALEVENDRLKASIAALMANNAQR